MTNTDKKHAWNSLIHRLADAYHEDGDTDFHTNAYAVAYSRHYNHNGAMFSYLMKNEDKIRAEINSIEYESDY